MLLQIKVANTLEPPLTRRPLEGREAITESTRVALAFPAPPSSSLRLRRRLHSIDLSRSLHLAGLELPFSPIPTTAQWREKLGVGRPVGRSALDAVVLCDAGDCAGCDKLSLVLIMLSDACLFLCGGTSKSSQVKLIKICRRPRYRLPCRVEAWRWRPSRFAGTVMFD